MRPGRDQDRCRARSGTAGTVQGHPATRPPAPDRAEGPFGAAPGADVFDALRATPARIDLSPGLPDLGAFPRTGWLRAERSVLAELCTADLGYGDPRGAPAMRRAVATWLARYRGIQVDPGEVVIVAGVAQAIGLFVPHRGRAGWRAMAGAVGMGRRRWCGHGG